VTTENQTVRAVTAMPMRIVMDVSRGSTQVTAIRKLFQTRSPHRESEFRPRAARVLIWVPFLDRGLRINFCVANHAPRIVPPATH
jgi:hypothetical protein